jgi:peptide methionine sulfoxide reductase MsrA
MLCAPLLQVDGQGGDWGTQYRTGALQLTFSI